MIEVSDASGNLNITPPISANMPTGIKPEDNFISTVLDLKQNYPNPFNPGTKIVFDLPKEDIVIISIYSITGETMTELFKDTLKPGQVFSELGWKKLFFRNILLFNTNFREQNCEKNDIE
ncbi:MAG: hypothetical protein Q7R95_05240 [bacterium]|nr:hypothetical protein [bacterium]